MTLELHHVDTLPVSAASALVSVDHSLWSIADDETMLVGAVRGGPWSARIVLVPDSLPSGAKERKRHKPDFESIAVLPDGTLLVLGSGSTPARRRGVVVDPRDPRDPRAAVPRVVDLTPLYLALESQLPELNVEGAVVFGDALVLAQRGNGGSAANALVRLDLARTLRALERGELGGDVLESVTFVELPRIDGVPYGFTDLATDGRALHFAAAAEDTLSTYDDGLCLGSMVGRLSSEGVLAGSRALGGRAKIEGLTLASNEDGTLRALLVADPDDRDVMAQLFRIDRLELVP